MGDIFDDEKEPIMTMQEFMEEMEAEEEMEADFMMENECTYTQGYLKRQRLFSCLTCTPAGNAGVCTACYLHCHDGHQVVELWKKRQFRCDCGNSKFGGVHCKLVADRDAENIVNLYNQNFKGLFCNCHEPYPDTDEDDEENEQEMIQCCICEDWFHENHLGLESTEKVPRDEEGEPIYEDFVCQDCVCHCPFLLSCRQIIIVPSILGESTMSTGTQKQITQAENNEKDDIKIETSETIVPQDRSFVPEESFTCTRNKSKGDDQSKQPCSSISTTPDNDDQSMQSSCACHEAENRMSKALSLIPSGVRRSEINQFEQLASGDEVAAGWMTKAGYPSLEDITTSQKSIAKLSSPLNQNTERTDVQVSECKLRGDVNQLSFSLEWKKPLFLAKNWRKLLCRCSDCHDLHRTKGVIFLLDEGDTLEEYEKVAKQRRAEKLQQQEAAELKFLQNLDHVEKIEILTGLREITDELHSFLGSFDTTRVVTCADVDEFCQNLRKKRRRLC